MSSMLEKLEIGERSREVKEVFVRHGLKDLLLGAREKHLPAGAGPAKKVAGRERAEHLRLAFEELGATFVKLGHYLASRPDILPYEFVEGLARIQDRARPVAPAHLKEQIERELERSVEEVFEHFEDEPSVSTSLYQTHRARLRGNAVLPDVSEVTVKVLRPGVGESVRIDLAVLEELAGSLEGALFEPSRDYGWLVAELRAALKAELDLSHENRNYRRLRESLAGFERLRVPKSLPELCSRCVLVVEHVVGDDLAKSLGKERRRKLSDELWRAYLKQILVDGAFHYHVSRERLLLDDQGRVVIQEPGAMAFLSRDNRLRLLVLLTALLEEDGERAAAAYAEIGHPGPKFKERKFARDFGRMVARSAGSGVGELALELGTTAFRHDVQVPLEIMRLAQTLSAMESICLELDPEMNSAETVREVVSSLLGDQVGRELSTQRMLSTALSLSSFLDDVPVNLRRIIGRASSNELRFGIRLERDEEMHSVVRKVADRLTAGLIISALIIGSALMLNVDTTWKVGGYPLFALLGFFLAGGVGLYLVAKTLLGDK